MYISKLSSLCPINEKGGQEENKKHQECSSQLEGNPTTESVSCLETWDVHQGSHFSNFGPFFLKKKKQIKVHFDPCNSLPHLLSSSWKCALCAYGAAYTLWELQ